MMEITLLGTSALMPLPDRALTAVSLCCAGRTILFDCGEGTQTAARRAGVSLMKTDLIALTHYHGDHIFGLPGLLQTMSCLGRTEPMWITGPKGLHDELAPILRLAGPTGFPVTLLEMPEEGLLMRDLSARWPYEARLSCFPTRHRVLSQGYAFQLDRAGKFLPEKAAALGVPKPLWGALQRGQSVRTEQGTVEPGEVLGAPRRGLRFVFSGDTTPCPALEQAAFQADLLILEGTYGDDSQTELAAAHGHMTFAQAGQTAARAGARRLWLTHFSQMIGDPDLCLPNAAAFFENAVAGRDGMRITLRFEEG